VDQAGEQSGKQSGKGRPSRMIPKENTIYLSIRVKAVRKKQSGSSQEKLRAVRKSKSNQ